MLKPKLLKQLLPKPVKADQVEVSMVASMHDEPAVPTAWLLDVCLHATEEAKTANLNEVSQRISAGHAGYMTVSCCSRNRLLALLTLVWYWACSVESGLVHA